MTESEVKVNSNLPIVDALKDSKDFDPTDDANLLETRLMLDQHYFDNLQDGRRMRKKPQQIQVLLDYFEKDPNWDYPTKICIAEQIGMTFSQVSKWNWDHRKKLGMSTERRRR